VGERGQDTRDRGDAWWDQSDAPKPSRKVDTGTASIGRSADGAPLVGAGAAAPTALRSSMWGRSHDAANAHRTNGVAIKNTSPIVSL